MRKLAVLGCLLALLLAACAPRVQGLGPEAVVPRLDSDALIAGDGARLPMAVWPAAGKPRAVLVALHGYNMYRNYFADPAPWWAERGITVYAYDQRGFGAAPEPGIWGGNEAMAADARAMVAAVRQAHPGTPLYLLGCSMGAAVALLVLGQDPEPAIDGAILIAPAVWGGEALNPLLRAGMWLTAHTTPWNRATGGGLRRRPTDNIDVLYRFGDDPLVIKYSRVDAIYGLTNLMGDALAAGPRVKAPLLILYGANDELVPPGAIDLLRRKLKAPHRFVQYPDGWHMLLHDKQARQVWRDIATWIDDSQAVLPSAH